LHLATIPYWVNVAVVGSASLVTLWRGGREERLIGGLQLFNILNAYTHLTAGSLSFGWPLHGAFPSFDSVINVEVVDVVEFAVCLMLALRGRSYWIIWASSALLLSVLTDALHFALPAIGGWAYGSAGLVWLYVVSLIVLWGALTRKPSEVAADKSPAPA
jgi:hypothetical protein